MIRAQLGIWAAITALFFGAPLAAAEPAAWTVIHPQKFEVVQREGYDPRHAHSHEPGGAKLGQASVKLELDLKGAALADGIAVEYRLLPYKSEQPTGEWRPVSGEVQGGHWSATVSVPAGWYRLEMRGKRGEEVIATAAVEPFGVGEVFVIAGQSYAVGANDELLKSEDPLSRVVAYDVPNNRWQVANDPQPNTGDGGTLWPVTGDLLAPIAGVPIGFVNVAVGGTATRQWLPGEKLYEQLAAAGKKVGRFRAVLWQQGESDVIEHRSTDYYVQNMVTIRAALAKEWGFEPTWLLAKSTLHPTVYNDSAGEGRIRDAIDRLWTMQGFGPGPDTDILDGENRGGPKTRRHFSGVGQRHAGQMWFAAIWQALNR